MTPPLRRRTTMDKSRWMLVGLLATMGCGGNDATEPPALQATSLSMRSDDRALLECNSIDAQADSAYHWAPVGGLKLDDDGTAELRAWIIDVGRSGGSFCGGSTPSQYTVRRLGTYTRMDRSLAFVWAPVSVPDTLEGWVTSEDLWLSNVDPFEGMSAGVLAFRGQRFFVEFAPAPVNLPVILPTGSAPGAGGRP